MGAFSSKFLKQIIYEVKPTSQKLIDPILLPCLNTVFTELTRSLICLLSESVMFSCLVGTGDTRYNDIC